MSVEVPEEGRGRDTLPVSDQREAQNLPQTQRIGPYRLLQTIGEGGMGEVWIADQLAPVRRRVAIKIIKLGMDTKDVVARFSTPSAKRSP